MANTTPKPNKPANSPYSGALALVLLRNSFYRDRFYATLVILFLLLILNAALMVMIGYKYTHPTQPQYFATTPDGRMIHWHPLSDPVVGDDYVLQWASNAVRSVFSLDYVHWRQQLQSASTSFTPSGWRDFSAALKASHNLKTLTDLKMVSNVTLTAPPQIEQKQEIDGVYAWKIKMPILVTYTNSERSIPTPLNVTLIVVRVPVQTSAARIAINNFLPEPVGGSDNTMNQVITGSM